MIFLSIFIFFYTSEAITLYSSSCDDVTACQFALEYYANDLKPGIKLEQVDKVLFARFLHPQPQSQQMASLSVNVYLIKEDPSSKTQHSDLQKANHADGVELSIRLTNFNRCDRIIIHGDSTYYQCFIKLVYISKWNTILNEIDYRVTVGVPSDTHRQYALGGSRILKNDCDCEIFPDAEYTTKMHIGTLCNNEITAEAHVKYGEYLCWEVTTTDGRISGARFEITSIKVSSGDKTIEVADLASPKCGAEALCERGRAYAIFRPLASGWLKYSMVVKFHPDGQSGGSSGTSRGMNINYSKDFAVLNSDGSVPPKDGEKGGILENIRSNLGTILKISIPVSFVGLLLLVGLGFLIYYCYCKKKKYESS